ncbi:MAG: GntR family transcriptional regulator [Syntrophomonadaceae bacterium]|jgi:GntR family transcriptional regulator|nr:GntR family transcriptional regulator [Syntrophomonadaceae bacterium]
MFLAIDFQSDTPIYMQLKYQIIAGIARGELKEGENLPSVRQLAQDIGINLHTVNKAYSLLKDDKYILMDRRKGAVINSMENMAEADSGTRLREEIAPLIAQAFCKGIKEDELLMEIAEIYRSFSQEVDR